MQVEAEARAYDAMSRHPRAADLATIARSVMTAAAQTRRLDHRPERVAKLASEMRLSRDEAATPLGNALDVLEHGPQDEPQRALARVLAAQVVAHFPPKDGDEQARLAADLLWLAAHTPFDATDLLDRALGDGSAALWDALARRVRQLDRDPAGIGRAEALLGGAALAASLAPGAAAHAATLAAEAHDAKLARVLGTPASRRPGEPITGELAPAPRGPLATTLLALTGVLLVVHVLRLFGKIALAYRRPAQIVLLDDAKSGVRVSWRVELLGRTLRDRDVVVPRSALVRASREVRYPRFALYAGLLSLAVGSYLGVSALVDGVRAASSTLLATGIVAVALGIALDFVLSSIAPGVRGRCRMLLVPRDGVALCVAGVDTVRADAALARLARQSPQLPEVRSPTMASM